MRELSDLLRSAFDGDNVPEKNVALRKAYDEIERLRTAGNVAFMAMCAHRDSPDDETFQDAIDVLGMEITTDAVR